MRLGREPLFSEPTAVHCANPTLWHKQQGQLLTFGNISASASREAQPHRKSQLHFRLLPSGSPNLRGAFIGWILSENFAPASTTRQARSFPRELLCMC
jgi:hypothetical protein